MALTNSEVQQILSEAGERVCFIQFNNSYKTFVGYTDSAIKSVNDIQFKTVGKTDMIGFPTKPMTKGVLQDIHPTYISWRLNRNE
jgi:hypothetical protein